jgi:hypothetical protein
MPTKRTRELQVIITPDEHDNSPAPLDELNAVMWRWSQHVDRLQESQDQQGNKQWVSFSEGPFGATEVRRLANQLRHAMRDQGHAILLLEEPRFDDDSRRILRIEVVNHEIEVESGPEE